MSEAYSYPDVENPHTRFICQWIDRMSKQYGSPVWDERRPTTTNCARFGWDWGQAICALQYGPFWSDYLNKHHIHEADEKSVELAKDWESGEWPEWAWTSRRSDNQPKDELAL